MLFSETYSQIIKSFILNKEETLKTFLEKEGLLDNLQSIRNLLCYDSLTKEEACNNDELKENSSEVNTTKLDEKGNIVVNQFEGKVISIISI